MYKPVIPSSLFGIDKGNSFNANTKKSNDYSLKSGVIITSHDIDSDKNISKEHVEYDIMSIEQNGSLGSSSVTYKNCAMMEGLGGVGDFIEVKRRSPSINPKKSKAPQELNGSIVLFLCLSGIKDRAIIIGALKHPKRKSNLTKKNENHMEGEFNGLNWKVDKDGALTITFKSATDNDGKPSNTKTGGTSVQIDKSGSVDVNTNLKGDDETYVRMDKTNKDVGVKAGQHIGLTAKKNIGLTAGADINAKATANLLADAGGSFTAKSGGAFNVQSGGPLSLSAPDIKIVADNMLSMKGSQIMLSAPQINVGDGGTPAVTLSTLVLTIGNLGMPGLGTMIGPFSSSVFIAP